MRRLLSIVVFLPCIAVAQMQPVSLSQLGFWWYTDLSHMYEFEDIVDSGISPDPVEILQWLVDVGYYDSYSQAVSDSFDFPGGVVSAGGNVVSHYAVSNLTNAVDLQYASVDDIVLEYGLYELQGTGYSSFDWWDLVSWYTNRYYSNTWSAMQAIIPNRYYISDWLGSGPNSRVLTYQPLGSVDLFVDNVLGFTTNARAYRSLSFDATMTSYPTFQRVVFPAMPTPVWYNQSLTGEYCISFSDYEYIASQGDADGSGDILGVIRDSEAPSNNVVNINVRLVVKDSFDILGKLGLSSEGE